MWMDAHPFFLRRISACVAVAIVTVAAVAADDDGQIEIEMELVAPMGLSSFGGTLFSFVPAIGNRLGGLVQTWHASIVDDYRWPMHFVANEIAAAYFGRHFSMRFYSGLRIHDHFSTENLEKCINPSLFLIAWPDPDYTDALTDLTFDSTSESLGISRSGTLIFGAKNIFMFIFSSSRLLIFLPAEFRDAFTKLPLKRAVVNVNETKLKLQNV